MEYNIPANNNPILENRSSVLPTLEPPSCLETTSSTLHRLNQLAVNMHLSVDECLTKIIDFYIKHATNSTSDFQLQHEYDCCTPLTGVTTLVPAQDDIFHHLSFNQVFEEQKQSDAAAVFPKQIPSQQLVALPGVDKSLQLDGNAENSSDHNSQISSRRKPGVSSKTSELFEKIDDAEKPFRCRNCDYRAERSSTMVRHCRIHTGSRPFVCQLCKSAFRYRSNLVDHQKLHFQPSTLREKSLSILMDHTAGYVSPNSSTSRSIVDIVNATCDQTTLTNAISSSNAPTAGIQINSLKMTDDSSNKCNATSNNGLNIEAKPNGIAALCMSPYRSNSGRRCANAKIGYNEDAENSSSISKVQEQLIIINDGLITSTKKVQFFACDLCDYTTPWKKCLRLHVNNKHLRVKKVKNGNRSKCPKSIRNNDLNLSISLLQGNISDTNSKSGSLLSICKLCQGSYTNLGRHLEKVHPDPSRAYSCKFCPYVGSTNRARCGHMKSHRNSRDLKQPSVTDDFTLLCCDSLTAK